MSYRLSTFVRPQNGERYPMLVDRDGMPAFYPTLFATSQLRGASKSTATQEQYLVAIRVLLATCERLNIDLAARIRSLTFLSTTELDRIRDDARASRRPEGPKSSDEVIQIKKNYKPRRLVAPITQYIYLTRIAEYVRWLCEHLLGATRFTTETADRIEALTTAIKARRPLIQGRTIDDASGRGITRAQERKAIEVLHPDSPLNPFRDRGVQVRNYLIFKTLITLGCRKGELLNIRVLDIDFPNKTVKIIRRADSKDDSRTRQPLVKTRERVLALSEQTRDELRSYVVEIRKTVPNSSRHPYLFVTHKSCPTQGQPLSLSSLQEMFEVIGRAFPDLQMRPHDLRHTWNERLSEEMENNSKYSFEEVEQMRNYCMGWSPSSTMGLRYNAKYIRDRAHAASLAMQDHFEEQVRAYAMHDQIGPNL